ncbi:MAG: shikimate dehydrogenase [bacterium]
MSMHRFAFIIHPLDAKKDMARKYPWARWLPESVINLLLKHKKPMHVSEIKGIVSPTGAEATGCFIGCPLTPKQMQTLPLEFVYDKIIQCGKLAEELGAELIGLGAFTSVVGDGGITIANNLKAAVTTGNSYTVATALEGTLKAAELMDIDIPNATVAVVGATGSIGRTCALVMAAQAGKIILIGRSQEKLAALEAEVRGSARGEVVIETDVNHGLKDADVVITVTSAGMPIIHPQHLKSGAVVCDVARPRDVSKRVVKERNDVLVIEGGVVQAPGNVEFNFNFGFPPGTAYACMSETMILALEGCIENFTLGKEVSIEQVNEITTLAKKHGFQLAGFRSFEKALTEQQIETVRNNARNKKPKLIANDLVN